MKSLTILITSLIAILGVPVFANEDFQLTSPDISEGKAVDQRFVLNGFGCNGENISPALEWSNAPEGTKSFAVTLYDPDAPTGSGWWHWVAFNIPADVTSLEQGAGSGGQLPAGVTQSITDFGAPGFGGACPPPGKMHRYQFRVHALSVEKIDLDENASPALVGFMAGANRIASAELTAIYVR